MANNDCNNMECIHNDDDGFCELGWVTLDLNGICTDIEIRSENG